MWGQHDQRHDLRWGPLHSRIYACLYLHVRERDYFKIDCADDAIYSVFNKGVCSTVVRVVYPKGAEECMCVKWCKSSQHIADRLFTAFEMASHLIRVRSTMAQT